MKKDLQKYTVYITQNTNLPWQQRHDDMFNKLCAVANKVVELDGTVELDKYFDPRYVNSYFTIKISPTAINEISKMAEVNSVKQ